MMQNSLTGGDELERIRTRLASPCCVAACAIKDGAATCSACGATYRPSGGAAVDFRLRRPVNRTISFALESPLPIDDVDLTTMAVRGQPEVDFTGITPPRHLTPAILSHFPRARSRDSAVLDLGCGDAVHRDVCTHAGFEYIGVDYGTPGAPFFGDAHALPFRDACFEFILSVAVFEHLRFPFVASREAFRVLEPGGMLVGTVAFLEPFHDNSFFHHSHLGMFNVLHSAGFEVLHVAPAAGWTVLAAQRRMLFPGMPALLSRALVGTLNGLHRAWWSTADLVRRTDTRQLRLRKTAGSFVFVGRKPADPAQS
jgi:SAM-dependent methyltransferase